VKPYVYVHRRPRPFIGYRLDIDIGFRAKLLILLGIPGSVGHYGMVNEWLTHETS
jgi:hypothetical protein